MKDLSIKNILNINPENQSIEAKAWVRTKRESKNLIFLELNDGSCLKGLQAVIDKDILTNQEKLFLKITTGSSVIINGKLVKSEGKNQNSEILTEKIDLIGTASTEEYPLQKKRHSFEYLREIAHLRPRTNTFGAVTRVRNNLSFAIHKFFQENEFQYINTPIITTSDCEGAGEMFQVTNLNLKDINKDNKSIDYSKDFFGKKSFLTVSGQLEAEIYACALKNVYTFGPTFRAENSNTSRHLAEFWMVEPEMAFCNINGNMDIAESFLKYVLNFVLENSIEDLEFFDQWIQKGLLNNLKEIVKKDFIRITYTEAINKLKEAKENFQFPVNWGSDLQSEHEKYLTEKVYNCPVIVTDYPKGIKAFYMKMNEDNKTVRAMDILVPRLGEIIGGSERESDYTKLKNRILELNLDPKDYWWYLELRKYGTVPHAGFGLGFERLVQYVTGMQNIRDVIPFPRAVKLAEF